MDLATFVMASWFPILLHLFATGYVAIDAPEYGMDRRRWAVLTLVVPILGFFGYILERSERTPDPDREMYTEGVFEIHESRADETGLEPGGPDDRSDHGNGDRE